MLSSWLEPDLFAVLFLGLAAPLLGLVALLTRSVRSRQPWWGVAALASAALAAAAGLTGQPRGFWLPPAVLAALCTLIQAGRSERVARAASLLLSLLRWPALQAAALVAAGPALAAAWVLWSFPAAVPWETPAELRLSGERDRLEQDTSLQATTDAGRPVPVYRPTDPPPPIDALREADDSVVATRGLTAGVIRTGPPTEDYNCHGWVFAGGRGWIRGGEVEDIVKDNGYYAVSEPRAGDLAIYRDAAGAISHSGVVRSLSLHGGPVLVESKWGGAGRFVSAATSTPYGAPTFYRSPRPGHLLHGLGEDDASGTLAIQEE